MITETKNPSGSPDPTVQGMDGETAETKSVLKDEKPCIRMHDITICISRARGNRCLHTGPCEPVDKDGNIIGLDRGAINDIIREEPINPAGVQEVLARQDEPLQRPLYRKSIFQQARDILKRQGNAAHQRSE